MKNLSLKVKLLGGFGIIAMITLIVGVIGWQGSNTLEGHINEISGNQLPSITNLLQANVELEAIKGASRTLLNPKLTADHRKEQFDLIGESRGVYTAAFEAYDKLEKNDEDVRLWNELQGQIATWRTVNTQAFEVYAQFEKSQIMDPESLISQLKQFRYDHMATMVRLAAALNEGGAIEGGEDHTSCGFGRWLTTQTSENPVIRQVIQDATAPHRAFHQAIARVNAQARAGNIEEARKIFNGELHQNVQTSLALLDTAEAEANKAANLLQQYGGLMMGEAFERQRDALGTMAELVANNEEQVQTATETAHSDSVQVTWANIIGIILGVSLAAIIGMVLAISITRALKQVIDSLNQGSEQVSAASGQVAESSQQMAQGASEQASSLEEVSSSLEEMASMTRQNADNSRQANSMASQASEAADRSREAMARMSDAINKIKASSDETAKIIKTIDEIAFQTNLLALNAAVEAARAGEAGKGFAVVAEEVRNLAQRSAEAAKNTAALIEGSQTNAVGGVKVSAEVEEILKQIVSGVKQVTQLIGEVSAASDEQAKGIDQINTAVAQMDQVTQSNAANAEESASASEELSAQARELGDMVSVLVRIVNGNDDNQSARSKPARRPAAASHPLAGAGQQLSGRVHAMKGQPAPTRRAEARPRPEPVAAGARPEQVIPFSDDELSQF